jgi:hypothetical protein
VYVHIVFICSSVDGNLGYFHFLVVVNSGVMNIGMQMPLYIVFRSFGFIPRSGITESFLII